MTKFNVSSRMNNMFNQMRYRQYTYIAMEYPKYPSLMINLKQILHSQKTKAEIDTGDNIEYDVTSYQVK